MALMDVSIGNCLASNCSVIQQRAGEWLLKQLNTIKDTDGSISMSKERILNQNGKKKDLLLHFQCEIFLQMIKV